MKFGTLFTGGGGADLGMTDAGLTPAWGIELEPDIAAVANHNLGDHVTVANILDCDPADYELVDALHASPPCPNFSNAKAGGVESELDIGLAEKVAEFIAHHRPQIFTLENVYAYRNSQSWLIIRDTLTGLGYNVAYWHLCAADYGVAQTRRRMIAVARRDGRKPVKPFPTHSKTPDMFTERWVGWYEAIEDIIDTLPDSEFANWQKSKISEYIEPTLIGTGGYGDNIVTSKDDAPAFTITKTMSRQVIRALLVPGGNSSSFSTRDADEPSRTVGDAGRIGNTPRAFIVDCQNGSKQADGTRKAAIRDNNAPVFTVTSSNDNPKANIQGRVVKMTPRALARFQSFPDWYKLPDNNALAIKITGNAVPPLLMRRVYEANTNGGGASSDPPVGEE
jgi:DNA (cytosine-5)-methyltransferase 1